MKRFEKTNLSDRVLTGVLGGVSKYTGLDSALVRILFVFSLVFLGFGLLPYVILWVCMPSEREFLADENDLFSPLKTQEEKSNSLKGNKI